jgi:hypothetical protein
MFGSRFGWRLAKKGYRFDKRIFRYRFCGDSPRLRMPLGAPASEEMHLNLAYLLVSSARSAGKVMITRFSSEEPP